MMDHSFNSSYDSQGAVMAIAAVDAHNDTHTVAAAYSPAGFLQGKVMDVGRSCPEILRPNFASITVH